MKLPHFVRSLCTRQSSCRMAASLGYATALIASAVVFATACLATTKESPPETLPQFVGGVVTRSAKLIYLTEQDSEVFAFYRNTPVTKITDIALLDLIRRPRETRVTELSWSAFFQLRTNRDSTGRWRSLQVYLEANLTDFTVFQVPRDAPYDSQYDLYAVGIFNGNTVVGVQMFGVAT